jgi:hypothetical protein
VSNRVPKGTLKITVDKLDGIYTARADGHEATAKSSLSNVAARALAERILKKAPMDFISTGSSTTTVGRHYFEARLRGGAA